METFGIVGMTFGIFGLIAFARVVRKKQLQIVGITAFIIWLAMFFPQLNNQFYDYYLIESRFDLLIRLSTFLIWVSSLAALNIYKD
jgi:ABC-type bacteriocin/lantibiotic exporter with double-glycine peptidase domain